MAEKETPKNEAVELTLTEQEEMFKPITKFTLCVRPNTPAQSIRDKVEAFIQKDRVARHVFQRALRGVQPAWSSKDGGYYRYLAEVTEAASKVVRVVYVGF